MCDALYPHSYQRPSCPLTPPLASCQEIVGRRNASPRISGQSPRGPGEFSVDVSRCLLYPPALLPFVAPPWLRRLCHWSHLHGVWRRSSRCPAHVVLCWLMRTIRLGYVIQFARLPRDIVAARNTPVLREEIAVLMANNAIEPVPPAEIRQGFYSPYFIVPKKGGGLRPNLDLRVLNWALHRLPFKILMHRRIIKYIQPQDLFAAIDLKKLTFMFRSFLRPFLRFAFEGQAWQYRVLPFGFSLSPRAITKVVESSLAPLREEKLCDHRDLVLRHLSQLGLRVNWEKSKLSPVERIYFLGVELDSVCMTACLTDERAQSVLNCLSSFRGRTVVPLKQFQGLLGHMASTATVTPLGLLHVRPLQHWFQSRVPRWYRATVPRL